MSEIRALTAEEVERSNEMHICAGVSCRWCELADSHEALRAALDAARNERDFQHERAIAAEQECERLRAALAKYGRHRLVDSRPCPAQWGVRNSLHGPCTCGLDAVLAGTTPTPAVVPATCPTCGSDDRYLPMGNCYWGDDRRDAWHGGPGDLAARRRAALAAGEPITPVAWHEVGEPHQ